MEVRGSCKRKGMGLKVGSSTKKHGLKYLFERDERDIITSEFFDGRKSSSTISVRRP
jgi:hypothetical protein